MYQLGAMHAFPVQEKLMGSDAQPRDPQERQQAPGRAWELPEGKLCAGGLWETSGLGQSQWEGRRGNLG